MSNVSEMVDSADQAKDELVANLRRVISDAEDLLAATAGDADSKIAELRARARQNLAVARDKLVDADAVLRAHVRRAMNAIDDYVHDNSWSSIGAAAAIGMLVGVLLGRR